MKRTFLILLALILTVSVCSASPEKRQIIDVTFNDVITSTTGIWNTSEYSKVAFYVDYDETQVALSISVAITVHISHDGTNFVSAEWSDFDGTGQSSETISSDGSYMGWFDRDITLPFLRITATATNTDDDDLADVDVFIVGLD